MSKDDFCSQEMVLKMNRIDEPSRAYSLQLKNRVMAKSLYKLSRELVGHTSDVRDLAVSADGSLISASRDKTGILWRFQDGNCIENVVMKGHGNFVSSVCIINPSEKFPKGFIITGSNDSHIFIYYPGETEPIHKIKGHENTVCSLKVSNLDKESFLSSSWDITAKLWNLNDLTKPQMTFIGHKAAVWCVSDLSNGSTVTGSADKNVNVYLKNGTLRHILKGHTDCVRDIAVINENEFLTCANDAIIKHWSAITGDCLGNFYGHCNYIYSMSAVHGGNLVVSSGEDKTIRVWWKGEIQQTITLPAQSVWCVKLLPNEDIACGSSDGIIRIFTTNADRYADSETLQRFEESVAHTQSNTEEQFGDIKSNDLSDSSSLNQPGKKDGEIKLVKEGGSVKAYGWSQKDLKWNLIGDVMGGNSSNSGKQLYNGIEYDYIFSVDIQDGVPPLKLPYNNGQDPWVVAQKFIDDNSLSQLYLEQVANFIIKNSTSAPIVNSEQFHDPFTGSSRHIPSSVSQNPSQTIETSMAKSSVPNPPMYIPQTQFLKLEQANITAIHEKLKEFNFKQELENQSILEDKLELVVHLATDQNKDTVEIGTINILLSLLNWPETLVFPVLDIARLAVLQKNVNDKLCTDELFNLLKRHLKKDATAANQMLTFRVLANMFLHEAGEKLCLQYKNEMLKFILELSSPGNKNIQVAISTYILNLVVALIKKNDMPSKIQVLNVISNCLVLFKDIEAVFRILVSLGTLLWTSSGTERDQLIKILRQSESTLHILQTAAESVEFNVHNKIIRVSKEINNLIILK